jgi:hypothetical protein
MLPVLQKLKAPALTREKVSRAPYFAILTQNLRRWGEGAHQAVMA